MLNLAVNSGSSYFSTGETSLTIRLTSLGSVLRNIRIRIATIKLDTPEDIIAIPYLNSFLSN